MKKERSIFVFCLCVTMFAAGSAFAGGVGSSIPGPQKEGYGIGVGVDGNFVFDRELKGGGAINNGNVEESNQVAVKFSMQPVKHMTGYVLLGAANLEEEFNWSTNATQKIKFDPGFLFGGGVNLVYTYANKFGIGWDNQLIWWHNEATSVSGSNSPSFVSKGSVNNTDFQSTVYVKYDYEVNDETFTPYLGLCYSLFRSSIDGDLITRDNAFTYIYGDQESSDNAGIVAGLNFDTGKKWFINVEGRFVSETAITGNAQYKF